MKVAILVLSICWSFLAFSTTEVIFLEVLDSKGETLFLEPNFPYAHVLIQINQRYLHAHPQTGVSWVELNSLEKFGKWGEALLIPKSVPLEAVEGYLGKAYDSEFSWNDDRFYCAELVAKLLGLSPEPMHFDLSLWPPSFQKYEGNPGISPSKIYKKIKKGWDFSFR